ncbi:Hypothetical protein SCLAV_1138 [Streptomyces clavuligerus]|uniref:Uncharacterized protein n=1 Tax=Streptomyces clavuligerus TaxID=1901 RepID=E2PYJ4_STRCL|nr:Hypothetical protein SCLAV_1138 [Streptomyces clavuligerus]
MIRGSKWPLAPRGPQAAPCRGGAGVGDALPASVPPP